MDLESVPPKKVCVIGAGPSGLVAARDIRREGQNVVVLEQNHDVGGQWLYDPNVDKEDPLGRRPTLTVHSSVYNSLRLATPRETIGYSDYPFFRKKGRDNRRFPSHTEYFLFLQDFTEHFGLREMIRFNTKVEYVGMLDYGEFGKELKWVVKSKNKMTDKVMEEVFDAVVVATGHYSQPRLPSIKGMDKWKGKQLHSHVYRVPEPFRGEVVVVIGNAQSGQDISLELVNVAKTIYLSSKSLEISEGLAKILPKHDTLHLRPMVESLHEDGRVVFVDGTWITADTIIFSTGYSYSFPFLETKGAVVIDDDRIQHLYEHTFPPSLAPSLSFIGIPTKIPGSPFLESQSRWIAQVLSGKTKLPSYDEMMESIKEFYKAKDAAGVPKHYTHAIGDMDYCDKYADYSGYPHLEEWRRQLFRSSIINAMANMNYRDEYDHDEELLKVAYTSPHFTQFGVEALEFE